MSYLRRLFFRVMIRQRPKRISDREPKRKAIRPAVSMKKSFRYNIDQHICGRVKDPQVIIKNIWWKRIKYFVKFVDIIAASAAIDAKNSPVPIQREEGRSVRRSSF